MTYEDYEREVARRFRNVRRAARRRVMDRVKEIVGGVLFMALIVALMYLIAKYTPSQYSAERDRLVAEAESQAAEGEVVE